jgi:ABC-type antimicrobial peptide transport system permease subunit
LHKPTLIVGALMIVLGIGAYLLTGRESVTAMIPTFVGVPILLCGVLAAKAWKPALIASVVLAVLAALGPLGRVIPAAIGGELEVNAALVTQVIFVALAVSLIVLNVKSLGGKSSGSAATAA